MNSISLILKWIIFGGTILILLTPLVVVESFFFPFVAPKSLYFMALVEIIFTAWLILIIFEKKYRPRFNLLFFFIVLFLFFLSLAGIFGVNPSRSFWSYYERMTGLSMWFHLLCFFLVLSSFFQKELHWEKIFEVSVGVSVIVSLIALKNIAFCAKGVWALSKEGATLGNSSFLGSYLLFNIFLASYLFFQKKEFKIKTLLITAGILGILTLFFTEARASFLSVIGGLFLLPFLYLSFKKKGLIKLCAIFFLFFFFSFSLFLGYLSLKKGSFVYQILGNLGFKGRYVVWEEAWKGFLERPYLGWGPENFEFAFVKYFDPRLVLREYGSEIWFDRAHNIVLDTLISGGIFALVSYIGIFLVSFYLLWQKFSQKKINFWTFSIFSVILLTYFLQNLTVFDMVSSYLMFFLILGFIGKKEFQKNLSQKKLDEELSFFESFLIFFILITFIFSFVKFVFQPTMANLYFAQALRSQDISQKLDFFKKSLETSPLGKYQKRIFFAETLSRLSLNKNYSLGLKKKIIENFEFGVQELKKSIQDNPLDYRGYLMVGTLYHSWGAFDFSKLSLGEEILKKALKINSKNQKTYEILTNIKIRERKYNEAMKFAKKAVEIEPRFYKSHLLLFWTAKIKGDKKLAKKELKKTLRLRLLELQR